MEVELKKALLEASNWQNQMTKKEYTKMPFDEARNRVVERIFKKYKKKILVKAK